MRLNFKILSSKSSSLMKTELEKYPIHGNQSKPANSRALWDFGNPHIQIVPKVIKSPQKYCKYVTVIIYAKIFQKTTFFGIVAFLLCKSSSSKKTIWTFGFFLTKKIFWVKHESLQFLKVFKVKLSFIFRIDAFFIMLNALWWILKKGHR